jgi:hypothetical protein
VELIGVEQTKLGKPPDREVEQGFFMVVNRIITCVGNCKFRGQNKPI